MPEHHLVPLEVMGCPIVSAVWATTTTRVRAVWMRWRLWVAWSREPTWCSAWYQPTRELLPGAAHPGWHRHDAAVWAAHRCDSAAVMWALAWRPGGLVVDEECDPALSAASRAWRCGRCGRWL